MKHLSLVLLFVFLFSFSYSQNAFNVLKPIFKKSVPFKQGIYIQRVSVVETSQLENAVRAAAIQSQLRQQSELVKRDMFVYQDIPVVCLTQEIKQLNCKPEQLYGGYNYLKTCSSHFSGIDWSHINRTTSYNGVHHIVTVQALKELYKISVNSYEKGKIKLYPFFNDMYKNAPSVFHILHNNPNYSYVFHNSELQLEIYNKRGIKGILDAYFENIIRLNFELNLTPIPEDVIKGTYVEAELWSVYFGLDWEK